MLFRCPTYFKQRNEFIQASKMGGSLRLVMQELEQGLKGREQEMWAWMMSGIGMRLAMEFLEQVIRERARLLDL